MTLPESRSASVKKRTANGPLGSGPAATTFWPVAAKPPFSRLNIAKSSVPSRLVSMRMSNSAG